MKIQGSYAQNINLLDMAEKTTPQKRYQKFFLNGRKDKEFRLTYQKQEWKLGENRHRR